METGTDFPYATCKFKKPHQTISRRIREGSDHTDNAKQGRVRSGTEQKNLFRGQCFRPGSTPAPAKLIALLKDERFYGQDAARAEEPLNFGRDDGRGVEI